VKDPVDIIVSRMEWRSLLLTLPPELQKICELADLLENHINTVKRCLNMGTSLPPTLPYEIKRTFSTLLASLMDLVAICVSANILDKETASRYSKKIVSDIKEFEKWVEELKVRPVLLSGRLSPDILLPLDMMQTFIDRLKFKLPFLKREVDKILLASFLESVYREGIISPTVKEKERRFIR